MIVDDRLDTVLRTQTAGRAGLNTQWRQLIDLLGRLPEAQWGDRAGAALERIDTLHAALGDAAAGVLVALCSIRSPALVAHLAQLGPRTALAAITRAQLDDAAWLSLIPTLPVHARGALRHRRDLGPAVTALLDRLGIDDFALPAPAEAPESAVLIPLPVEPAVRDPARGSGGIGAIVRRIEAFRRDRARAEPAGPAQSRLPFAEDPRTQPPLLRIDCLIDAAGMIVAADGADAAMLVGHRPFVPASRALTAFADADSCAAFAARRPVRAGWIVLDGAAAIAGTWRIDAMPRFAANGGAFAGYAARLRRPDLASAGQGDAAGSERRGAEQLHQVLHELRTPINAIQGFAELIQQQLLGETPHHYRALAATIAADAARMLAGFEDVERLIRLESGRSDAVAAPAGDLAVILGRVRDLLTPSVERRSIALAWSLPDHDIAVAMASAEIERTVWRLVSTLISAAAPGERLDIDGSVGSMARITATLPASLAGRDADLFEPDIAPGGDGALLGHGFALRLCRAEAHAAGGTLERQAGKVVLALPLAPAVVLDRDAAAS